MIADAGYWHKRQVEDVVTRGIQALIPPDSGLHRLGGEQLPGLVPPPRPLHALDRLEIERADDAIGRVQAAEAWLAPPH